MLSQGSLSGKKRGQQRKNQRDGSVRKTLPNVVGSEDRGRIPVQEGGNPLEDGKGKEVDFPLEPPGGDNPADTSEIS